MSTRGIDAPGTRVHKGLWRHFYGYPSLQEARAPNCRFLNQISFKSNINFSLENEYLFLKLKHLHSSTWYYLNIVWGEPLIFRNTGWNCYTIRIVPCSFGLFLVFWDRGGQKSLGFGCGYANRRFVVNTDNLQHKMPRKFKTTLKNCEIQNGTRSKIFYFRINKDGRNFTLGRPAIWRAKMAVDRRQRFDGMSIE